MGLNLAWRELSRRARFVQNCATASVLNRGGVRLAPYNEPMRLDGVFAPLPTPFDDTGQLDCDRLRAALPYWVTSPLDGFVMLGTNGEAGLLSEPESADVIATAREVIPPDRLLIAGTGRDSTRLTIEATRTAARLGADAVLVRTPSYFKGQMKPDVFVRHYLAVADASPVPVLLYNFAAATGVNMLPDVVGLLAQHPNIHGIKESGSDIAQLADLAALVAPGFRVLAGSASTLFAALCVGVSGAILALAAVRPLECTRLYTLTRAGRLDEARLLQRRLLPLGRLISSGWGVPGLKAALALSGIDAGFPRAPLAPVPEAALIALKDALSALEDLSHEPVA